MHCCEEGVTMIASGGTMRKRPRPKMKASKKRRSSIRTAPVGNKSKKVPLSIQPQIQNGEACEAEVKQTEKEEHKDKLYDDPVICMFCDDGGNNILSCEGICHRHFHANKEDDETPATCQTLGFSPEMVKSIDQFMCENCKHEMHQCFICGELGSSNDEHREVYMCHVDSCKKFYHLHCVLKLRGVAHGTLYVKQIVKGTIKLFCPRHRCDSCKTEDFFPGKLVQCRRCPKAWHVDCLRDFENSGELESREVWEHDRFKYIYCRKHEILPDLETPRRDHVKFPSCE